MNLEQTCAISYLKHRGEDITCLSFFYCNNNGYIGGLAGYQNMRVYIVYTNIGGDVYILSGCNLSFVVQSSVQEVSIKSSGLRLVELLLTCLSLGLNVSRLPFTL